MKVSSKWSEEASIFSKLQVYENIHESFFLTLQKELVQVRFLGISRKKYASEMCLNPTYKINVIAKVASVFKYLNYFL